MKCLKVEEYIKQTGSVEETDRLRQELEVSLFTNPFKSDNFQASQGILVRPTCHVLTLACVYSFRFVKTCVFRQSYVKSGPSLQGRTLCDRVIRACNHQLGVGSPDHVVHLVQLVEVSLHGYDVSSALVAQSTPLYMEKIIFHIVKKLSSLEAHHLGSHVAGLLYNRLIPAQQVRLILFRIVHTILHSFIV